MPREALQLLRTRIWIEIKVSQQPLWFTCCYCLHLLPSVQILDFRYPHLWTPSPWSPFAVTHMRKGLRLTALCSWTQWGWNLKKKILLKLVRVAGSYSLLLEMFLFSKSAREKRGERGHGHRDYIQNGLEWAEALTPVHSAMVSWASTAYCAPGIMGTPPVRDLAVNPLLCSP